MREIERYLRQALHYFYAARDGYPHVYRYQREALKHIRAIPDDHILFAALKRMVIHAYTTTEYYRNAWDDHGITPDAINDFPDIRQLPFLTKEILQAEKDRMVSDPYKNQLETSYTGGSSGNPTSFYRNKGCTAKRMGRQLGILESCGYKTGDRCGLIWGAHADLDLSSGINLKKRLRQFASGKETLCCTVMNEAQMKNYHSQLINFSPKVLYGYPNAMTEFAKYIQDNQLAPIRVKKIFCTAERLNQAQREFLSQVFGGEVFNLYCTREHGCIGFECQEHNGFHIDTGSVYLEIIIGNESVMNTKGEIVITDLLNDGMPFIRNKIGDMGVISSKDCACGCRLPMLERFDGRVSDMLYRSDGKLVSGLMLLDMLADVPEIEWFQVVQKTLTEFDMFLVVNQGFNHGIEQLIRKEMHGFFTHNVTINIHLVPEIPRNLNSGKFQEVICQINPHV